MLWYGIMPDLQTIYSHVLDCDPRRVDQAMAEALPSADPEAAGRLVGLMLERETSASLAGLVGVFHRLGRADQQRVIEQADRLAGYAATELAGDLESRLNLVQIIGLSGCARLARLLNHQLRIRDERLTRAASGAMVQLTERVIDRWRNREPGAIAQLQRLSVGVAEACASFSGHRRRGVLRALARLMAMADQQATVALNDRSSAVHAAQADLIDRLDDEHICRAITAYAARPPLQQAVVRSLARPHAQTRLIDFVVGGHLAVLPQVRQTFKRISNADHLCPSRRQWQRMDTQAQRRAVMWLGGLPLSDVRCAEALDPAQASDSPCVRLLALRRLMNLAESAAMHTIAAYCFDAQPLIARIALRYLIHRRYEQLPALLARLSSSPHPPVRRLAEIHLAPTGFARLWAAWPRLDQRTRISAGRALIKIDDRLNHKLAEKMRATNPDDRLQALSIVRLLKLETYFERELFTLDDDADPRVVSSVIAALPALGDSPEVRRRVILALKHENDRVCSNAIEAIEAMGIEAAAAPVLQRFAERGENRSRATAIKALMQLPMSEAIGELVRMLDHDQPAHRVSALWVVQQLELLGLVHKVAALAKTDPQSDVRRRALGTIRQMIRDRRRGRSADAKAPAQPGIASGADESGEAVA